MMKVAINGQQRNTAGHAGKVQATGSRGGLQGRTLSLYHYAAQDLVRACGLDAAAFWAEVQSVLKGGAAAVQSPHGRLPADGYAALAEQRASDLSAERRSAVYDLFLQYEQLRRQRGHWDIAGFTAHVFSQLWTGLKVGKKPMQVSSNIDRQVALTAPCDR